jgi:hypothetical protein
MSRRIKYDLHCAPSGIREDDTEEDAEIKKLIY